MKITLIVIVLLILAAFIPFQQHASINIRANYFEVCQQLASADNWKRWQPDIRKGFDLTKQYKPTTNSSGFLINIPGQTFKVESISANTFKVIRTVNYLDHECFYTVVPGDASNTSTVIIDTKNNVGKWLFSKFDSSGSILDVPRQLKSFMEDAKQYYGFNISEKSVAESYLVVKKEIISTQDKYQAIVKAVRELHSYINQNNIKPIQALSGAYYPQRSDSLQIMVGIPVNKQLNSTGDITFMHMPGGKWLVGDYKGKYSGRQQLYKAMEKYMQDHALLKQIAPFERYLDNKPPASDDDVINMQVNYPVL
ncbi:effector-binding domain-containing protein [Mucilaginibacter lappiensis]|uniref:Effector-binding domain-containing protein n=1 Tax=Mucilaginibacter lappiensis TaxID=354630 RepID=A0ABR6PML1_9SPHI|nr:GyrI-like domain-containing protein [Mucilaginibacter lappiensis]MBB6110235.1 effector-binding domain-containing protein [Mucilaginibacter lappiensis]SIR27255.1 effector-binding domain-containing protein [Mucilaginibacter lappiensis]